MHTMLILRHFNKSKEFDPLIYLKKVTPWFILKKLFFRKFEPPDLDLTPAPYIMTTPIGTCVCVWEGG